MCEENFEINSPVENLNKESLDEELEKNEQDQDENENPNYIANIESEVSIPSQVEKRRSNRKTAPIDRHGTYVQYLHASRENAHDLGPNSTQILALLMQHCEDKTKLKLTINAVFFKHAL